MRVRKHVSALLFSRSGLIHRDGLNYPADSTSGSSSSTAAAVRRFMRTDAAAVHLLSLMKPYSYQWFERDTAAGVVMSFRLLGGKRNSPVSVAANPEGNVQVAGAALFCTRLHSDT